MTVLRVRASCLTHFLIPHPPTTKGKEHAWKLCESWFVCFIKGSFGFCALLFFALGHRDIIATGLFLLHDLLIFWRRKDPAEGENRKPKQSCKTDPAN